MAGQKKLIFTSFSELSQAPEVYDLVMQAIESVNQTLPRGCRVMKYVNLRKEFDPDEGELTRTRNLRRLFLEKRYRELIDAIYAGEDEGAVQTRIKYRDGRIGTSGTTLRIQALKGTRG